MKTFTRTIYAAFDGVQFDTEKECSDHETLVRDSIPKSSICLFDEDFNVLDLDEYGYDVSYFIYVGDDEGADILKRGHIFGEGNKAPTEKGFWRYNFGLYKWENMKECMHKLESDISKMEYALREANK